MKDVQSLNHTRLDCKYHVVFIPKRRKKRHLWGDKQVSRRIFHELARQQMYNVRECPTSKSCTRVDTLMDARSCPPVAFLIFNRPELTSKVFATIAQAQPSKLLVVADGPRTHVPDDGAKCLETRAIIGRIDWDCEVLTNFSPVNMGCRARISTGLDWVFTNVEEAIILEDDCIPHPTFFRFCKELLARYRDDRRVMMISGNNVQMGQKRTPYSYYFSKSFHCWGWATWRRAWQHYDIGMELWPALKDGSWLLQELGNKAQARTFRKLFNHVAGESGTWDYQWVFSCLVHNGLSIVPSRNLVTNVGFSEDRTSVRYHPLGNLPVEELEFPLKHPPFMVRQADADAFEHRIEYGWFRRAEWTWRLRQAVAYYWKHPRELLPFPYRVARDLVPLKWRKQIRDRLGLPHGISLAAALMRRPNRSTRSILAHIQGDSGSICLMGPLHLQTGLGESFRSIVRASQTAGIRTSIYDLEFANRLHFCGEEPSHDHGTECRETIFNILHFGADLIPTAYKIFGSAFFSRRYNIGYWVWETEKLPESWRPYVKAVDEIWTPSAFCRHIFSRETHVPVFRMPHNVAPQPPAGINRRELGLPDAGFIFLVMADFASIAERKNPLGAIEAFLRAFGLKREGVFLCLKTIRAHPKEQMMQAIESFLDNSESIIHFDDVFDRSRINALINACDCLVSLHRSEGFGLPIAEAMVPGETGYCNGILGQYGLHGRGQFLSSSIQIGRT